MKKIVIKIGGALNTIHGVPNLPLIESFAKEIWQISQEMELFVIFVLSGAIPIGFRFSKDEKQDFSAEGQSLYSMMGQSSLFASYENTLRNYGFLIASGTYTGKTLTNPHTKKVFQKAIKKNSIVLVNEADNVNPEEIFGDNDLLASKIAVIIKADILILLSAIKNGIEYPSSFNNKLGGGETFLKMKVNELTDNFISELDNGEKSRPDSHGIQIKLQAAKKACQGGVPKIFIANGNEKNILQKIILKNKRGTLITL